jgi:hypothetical protein
MLSSDNIPDPACGITYFSCPSAGPFTGMNAGIPMPVSTLIVAWSMRVFQHAAAESGNAAGSQLKVTGVRGSLAVVASVPIPPQSLWLPGIPSGG